MSSLAKVWKQLAKTSIVQFKAESFSGIGWDGLATGLVKVSEASPGTLIFEESGQFRKPDGMKMTFRNTFRWSQIGDKIRLEHLRFGADNPVFLFDMALDTDGIWREISPHACRDDCYAATLRIEKETLFVRWSVSGPTRNEVIDYTYM